VSDQASTLLCYTVSKESAEKFLGDGQQKKTKNSKKDRKIARLSLFQRGGATEIKTEK